MFLVTMKSTEGASLAIKNLDGKKIGKHKIKAGPYKSKEQINKERMEREDEERRNREQSFENCDTSEVQVIWVSGE